MGSTVSVPCLRSHHFDGQSLSLMISCIWCSKTISRIKFICSLGITKGYHLVKEIMRSKWQYGSKSDMRQQVPFLSFWVPSRALMELWFCTAEDLWFWLPHIGPYVLKNWLKHKYYKHFMKLNQIVKLCLCFTISWAKLQQLQKLIIKYVEEDEWIIPNVLL